MRPEARRKLRAQYDFRCGYCGVSESDAGGPLTTDHFQPRSRGGTDEPDNRVYCCFTCNSHKGNHWSADPSEQLLHPPNDDASAHIRLMADGTISALTERGRLHLETLHLNRTELVAHRQALLAQSKAAASLSDSMEELEALRQKVAELERELVDARLRLSSM